MPLLLILLKYFFSSNMIYFSYIFFSQEIYWGLAVICGFLILDIQNIIEKARRGGKDHLMHSIELFIDFVGIFKYFLLISFDDNILSFHIAFRQHEITMQYKQCSSRMVPIVIIYSLFEKVLYKLCVTTSRFVLNNNGIGYFHLLL